MEKTKLGGKYLYHHDDYLGKHIQKTKEFYEIDFLRFSHEKLKATTGFILDIGANIGNHTIYRARKGHSVMAIEPSIDNIEVLKKNCGMFENIVTVGWAVANYKMPFHIKVNEENRGADTVVVGFKDAEYTHITDELMKIILDLPIKLLKIDVEGMELQVLMGASTIIQRYLPDIMIELNDKKTLRYLRHLGYEVQYKRKNNKTMYLSHKIWND